MVHVKRANSSLSFLPFKGVFDHFLSFSFSLFLSLSFRCCFCQPAREQFLSWLVSLFDCSLLFRRFLSIPLRGFCYSFIQRTAEPVQKEHNAEFLYEPGRRSAQRYGLCARRWKLNAFDEVFFSYQLRSCSAQLLTGFSYESSSPCAIELILGVSNKLRVTSVCFSI